MIDEKEIYATATERPTRRRRRRRKEYTDATYGARLPHEDARIADEYARLHKLDRADVVRLAMKQFAYKQQMRYQPKSELAELREQVFREHFAPVSQQLEVLSAALNELPQTLLELHAHQSLRISFGNAEKGETRPNEDGDGGEFARHVEAELRSQRRALEQAHFASVLTLRLVTNYLVEPQLRRIEASDVDAMKPHLRAARDGNEAWGVGLGAVMKLTGERVMTELGITPPVKTSGTDGAAKNKTENGGQVAASALSDAETATIL